VTSVLVLFDNDSTVAKYWVFGLVCISCHLAVT